MAEIFEDPIRFAHDESGSEMESPEEFGEDLIGAGAG